MLNEGLYRRNGKRVYIKQPKFNEMSFVRELWNDEETMKDIGGVFDFSENKWEMFYKKMVQPTDGKNFYCLVYNNRDIPIGEVSFHGYDSATSIARFNAKILAKYRGNGYGEEAVRLLLEYYFSEFGGNIIMDHIVTESGAYIAKRLGFEEIRKTNESTTIRISKKKFLNYEKGDNTNIEVLILNDMNIMDYTMPFEIFNKANKIYGSKLFNIYGVALDKNIRTGSGVELNVMNNNPGHKNPNVIIIPGGIDIINYKHKDSIVDYILSCYNNCDYICAFEEGINVLIICKELNGVLVPKGDWINDIKEINEASFRMVNRNYTDNGKIMLSTNLMGTLELCLNLIKKIGGDELEGKVEQELGLKK